jgi:predicted nucleic acid-binding protein
VKVALDTNVIVYAEGLNDARRGAIAQDAIEDIARGNIVLPLQVLGEFCRVLQRKARRAPTEIAVRARRLHAMFDVVATTPTAFDSALALTERHGLQFWDSVIVATSAEAGCRLLLSEHLQDGFEWMGLTVANPFSERPHPLLAPLLRGDRA